MALLLPFGDQSLAQGIRAGLDYKFIAIEGSKTTEVVCDFCGYVFSDGETTFQAISVNADNGYVQLIFLRKSDYTPQYSGPKFNYNDITIANGDEFPIDYYQVVQVREGQSVHLRGTATKVKIIDVFGHGCPVGAMC